MIAFDHITQSLKYTKCSVHTDRLTLFFNFPGLSTLEQTQHGFNMLHSLRYCIQTARQELHLEFEIYWARAGL